MNINRIFYIFKKTLKGIVKKIYLKGATSESTTPVLFVFKRSEIKNCASQTYFKQFIVISTKNYIIHILVSLNLKDTIDRRQSVIQQPIILLLTSPSARQPSIPLPKFLHHNQKIRKNRVNGRSIKNLRHQTTSLPRNY